LESQNPPAEATENFVRASTRSIWDADRGPGRCVSPRSCRQVTRGSRGAGVSNPPSRRVRPRMASVRRKSLRCVGRVRLGLEDRSRTRSWMRRRMPHIGGTGWPRKPNESLLSVMKSPDLTNRYDPTLLRLFNCQALRRPRPNSEILFGRETRVTSLRHFSRKTCPRQSMASVANSSTQGRNVGANTVFRTIPSRIKLYTEGRWV
jgi:hypothetical protein